MPASATYDSLATTTVGSATSSIVFSGISQAFTDLVVVIMSRTQGGGADSVGIRLNGDSGTNYNYRVGAGNGSTTSTALGTNETSLRVGPQYGTQGTITAQIMGYSATNMWKPCIARNINGNNQVGMTIATWRSTAAVTSVTVVSLFDQFATGSVVSIYGIAAA